MTERKSKRETKAKNVSSPSGNPETIDPALVDISDYGHSAQSSTGSTDFHKSVGSWTAIVAAVTGVLILFTGVFENKPASQTTVIISPKEVSLPIDSTAEASELRSNSEIENKDAAAVENSSESNPQPPPIPPPVDSRYIVPLAETRVPPDLAISQSLPISLRLRKEPNEKAKSIGVIEQGDLFYIGEKMGNYYYAALESGTRGFVRAEIVDKMRPKLRTRPPSSLKEGKGSR